MQKKSDYMQTGDEKRHYFLSQIEINSKNNARIIANKIIMQDAKDGHRKM